MKDERERGGLRRASIASFLAGAVLVSGCSGLGGDGDRKAAVPTPTTVAVARLRLPIDAYLLTPEQEVESDNVKRLVIRSCMRRFGFEYPTRRGKILNRMDRRYGISDPAVAARYGYHPDPESAAGATLGPGYRPSPAARQVLAGPQGASKTGSAPAGSYQGQAIPPGGCMGEADRALADTGPSSSGDPSGLLKRIEVDSYNRSKADKRVVAAMNAWSSCMKAKGYSFGNSLEAGASFAKNWDAAPSGAIPAAEIETAVADIGCKKQTNVNGIWYAAECEYENKELDEHAPAFADIKKAHETKVRRLQEMIKKYGS